ncbi:MAG TPA: YqzM family protein [Pseudogracilibacillus sp.]|nr:YqzM family protein [Pseudogracilibacillus sp.]
MNEFEKDPQYKGSDVVDSIKGFTASLVFFIMIFGIGVVISLIN